MKNLYDEIQNFSKFKLAIIENNKTYSYKALHKKIDFYDKLLSLESKNKLIGIDCIININYVAAIYACFKQKKIPIILKDKTQKGAIKKMLGIKTIISDEKIINSITNNHYQEKKYNKDISTIFFTSGTTSKYLKGVKLSHESISHVCKYMNKRMDVNKSIIEQIYAPIDHAFAFGRMHSVLSVGGTVILPKNLIFISSIIKDINKFHCNALSTLPLILDTLLKLDNEKINLIKENIRWIQVGTMRMNNKDRDRVINTFSKSRIFYHYGMTEAMRTTFLELNKEREKKYTEGKPISGVKISILDIKGKKQAANKIGNIAIKGKNLFSGYINSKENFLKRGWYLTADRGYLDEHGYLVYKGRKDDLINIKGKLLNLAELEEKITSCFPNQKLALIPVRQEHNYLLLVIEGEVCKKTRSKIKKTLFCKNIILDKIIFINKFPRSKTMKVSRNKILELINKNYG